MKPRGDKNPQSNDAAPSGKRFDRLMRQTVIVGRRRIPPGVRSVLGILLMIGGVLGFLPILGFWMLPLGLILIALDIPPLRRRVTDWIRKRRNHGKPP